MSLAPRFPLLVLLACVSGAPAGPVAQPAEGTEVGPDAAAQAARSHAGGRVLGVERVEAPQGTIYEVKLLLENGRVRIVRVDAGTGTVR